MRLDLVSAGAAQGLVGAVARAAGVKIAGSFGAVGAMWEKVATEPCDVVILTHAQLAELTASGRVAGETVADLGSVDTAIAVRDAAGVPDVSSESALRASLLAADALYFPDPAKATAGIHFAKVLDALGIRAEVEARVRTFPNGATAMRAMAAASGHPLGCTQATEILATPGVKLVGPLPRGCELSTVYTAAVAAGAAHPADAARFVERLAGPASLAERAAAGFRGYAVRPIRAGDHAAVARIVEEVLGEYGLALDAGGIDADLADIDGQYLARGGAFDVVVDAGGAINGCCGVHPLDRTACELRKMYLVKGARGAGVGARLLRRALSFARGRGFRRMELETASVLKEAIALYRGAGFRPIERAHLACRCDRAFALDLAA